MKTARVYANHVDEFIISTILRAGGEFKPRLMCISSDSIFKHPFFLRVVYTLHIVKITLNMTVGRLQETPWIITIIVLSEL